MVQIPLVGVAVGITLVGLVSLAVRILKWTRKNRHAVSGGIAESAIGNWLGELIDNLNHSGSHSHSGHDSSHCDVGHHPSDSSGDGGGIDSGHH